MIGTKNENKIEGLTDNRSIVSGEEVIWVELWCHVGKVLLHVERRHLLLKAEMRHRHLIGYWDVWLWFDDWHLGRLSVFSRFCAAIRKPDLYSILGKVSFTSDFFSQCHVRILISRKVALQNFDLRFGKASSRPSRLHCHHRLKAGLKHLLDWALVSRLPAGLNWACPLESGQNFRHTSVWNLKNIRLRIVRQLSSEIHLLGH